MQEFTRSHSHPDESAIASYLNDAIATPLQPLRVGLKLAIFTASKMLHDFSPFSFPSYAPGLLSSKSPRSLL